MHWATLRRHSDLFRAATSASSNVIPILNKSLLTVLLQLVHGWPGPLLNPGTSQCNACRGMCWWSIHVQASGVFFHWVCHPYYIVQFWLRSLRLLLYSSSRCPRCFFAVSVAYCSNIASFCPINCCLWRMMDSSRTRTDGVSDVLLCSTSRRIWYQFTVTTFCHLRTSLHLTSLRQSMYSCLYLLFELEGTRESAYLHQVNFYWRPLSKNFNGSCPDCPWKRAHLIWSP